MTMRMRSALGAAAVCALAGAASAGVVAEYQLADHPDGSAAPPTYGLRLDGLFGGSTTTTFSFVDVTLTVFEDDMDGTLSMNISGEVFGGEVSGNSYTTGGDTYLLDFNYTANVSAMDGGWVVSGTNPSNNGSLTLVGVPSAGTAGNSLFTFTDNNNNAFLFLPDGHRLNGDNSSWVGRGWLTTDDGGHNTNRTQDWLFTGELIPSPGTIAIASLGLLAAGRRRR